VFGKWGAPQMGGAGCGWATALSFWVMLILMFWFTRNNPVYKSAYLYKYLYKINIADIKKLLTLGVPIGLTILVEASIFAFITLFLGGLEAYKIAGHQIAMNVAFVLFMFPLSLSISCSIRSGFNLGRKDRQAARQVGFAGITLAFCIALVTSTVLFIFPEHIAGLYTDDAAVIEQAASLLFFAALFQFSDALVTPMQGVLRGYHDTTIALLLSFLAYWIIALPLGYFLGLTDWIVPMMEAKGFWISLVAGLTIAGLLLFPRFMYISRV
jgi:MATE family multidrug resistance protein